MIRSMTGYGRAEAVVGKQKIVVEIRSTNHRYSDICVRISPKYSSFENEIKRLVLSRLSRGRIDLFIQCENEEEETLTLDLNLSLAERYYALLKQLKESLQLPGAITLSSILAQKDVVVPRLTPSEQAHEWGILKAPLSAALDDLLNMRCAEGRVLKEDFISRVEKIGHLLSQIQSLSLSALQEYQKHLREKIQALSKHIEIDDARLAQEVAYLVEKSDTTEELVRAQSHLLQFKSWLEAEDAVGRKLDFLIQELHREVNTIGSKSCHAEISLKVVEIKNELEKIREQVQNVE
jgi:uncharacterized protein (TIGR00255 family)